MDAGFGENVKFVFIHILLTVTQWNYTLLAGLYCLILNTYLLPWDMG